MKPSMKRAMMDTIARIITNDPWHSSPSYISSALVKQFDIPYTEARGYLSWLVKRGALNQMKGKERGFPMIVTICYPLWDTCYNDCSL